MIRNSLPVLLFRQTLILALMAGACSVRAPEIGAALLVLLVFVPERERARLFLARTLKLLAAFLLGLAVTWLSMEDVPDKPSWASVPRQAVLVEGVAESVTGLPGGRIRVLLGSLRQAEMPLNIESDRAEHMRKAMEPPRFASSESGRKSYAGAVYHGEEDFLPGLAALTLDAGILEAHGRPVVGQKVTALLRLFPSGGSRNAMESGPGRYWAAREVWHNARLVRQKREALFLRFDDGKGLAHAAAGRREAWHAAMERMLGEAGSQGKAMLTALLFGDRSGLSLRTVDLFTRAGLVHSLALSGQHLALAALFGVFFVFVLSLASPRLFQLLPKRTFIACAGLPFALCYLFLGGAPFSLVRASFMMLAGAVFLCMRRPVAPLDALFAAVLLLFMTWPQAVFDLSAQLSVLAVAGIMLSLPLISVINERIPVRFDELWYRRWAKKALRWALALIIVSFAAQTAVLPILASMFGSVSPCFWLNLLWLPPLTFVTLPLAALGLLLIMLFGTQALSALMFEAAAWPADLMLFLLEYLDASASLPFVQCFRPAPLSSLGYGAVLAALAFLFQRRIRKQPSGRPLKRVLCFGLLFMLAGQAPQWLDDVMASFEKRVTLSMIDVGAGQSVLLEYPGGRVLIDGGGNNTPFFDCGRSIVAPLLTEGRLPRLDAVIVSHCDVDHARGLRWILEHFRVGALYWSSVSAERAVSGEGKALRDLAQKHGIPEKILKRGDAIALGNGLKLEVLAPGLPDETVPSEKELSSNDASLALRLSREGQGLALLCGDMLSPALERLAGSGQELKAEVLVLPHHGAASSFQRRFYDAVAPRLSLASAAPFSHFGFPSRKVRQEMEERGIPLLSTSELGTFRILWKFEKGKYVLSCPLPQP
ncbi:MAG: ComEC/Rec2 family competence protein [Mailhella sp.]|nr:ComEC/Rec2 family competence protein [Mailhella sp.]